MIRQYCYSMRPSTVFLYKGRTVECLENHTLRRVLKVRDRDSGETFSLRYIPGASVKAIWRPFRLVKGGED